MEEEHDDQWQDEVDEKGGGIGDGDAPWHGRVLELAERLEEIANNSDDPIKALVDLAHEWVQDQEVSMTPSDISVSKEGDASRTEYRVSLQWRLDLGLGVSSDGRLELTVAREGDHGTWSFDESPLMLDDIEDIEVSDFPSGE